MGSRSSHLVSSDARKQESDFCCHFGNFLVRGFETCIVSPIERHSVLWLNLATRQICVSDRKHDAVPPFAFKMRTMHISPCRTNASALVLFSAEPTEPNCTIAVTSAHNVTHIIKHWYKWLEAGQVLEDDPDKPDKLTGAPTTNDVGAASPMPFPIRRAYSSYRKLQ